MNWLACRHRTHAGKKLAQCAHDGVERAVVVPSICETCEMREAFILSPDLREPSNERDLLDIIAVYFNPLGWQRREDNLQRFLSAMEAAGHRVHLEVDNSGEVIWQKEALIHKALRSTSKPFVAIVDCDVIFESSTWAEHSVQLLEGDFDVVQPFETVDCLNAFGETVGDVLAGHGFQSMQGGIGHPGFAWVARRELLEQAPREWIVGGGDAEMVRRWEAAGIRLGYIPGTIQHLWHGDRTNRQYGSRQQLLERYQFDVDRDVMLSPAGTLQWTGENPRLEAAVAGYFRSRCEDG